MNDFLFELRNFVCPNAWIIDVAAGIISLVAIIPELPKHSKQTTGNQQRSPRNTIRIIVAICFFIIVFAGTETIRNTSIFLPESTSRVFSEAKSGLIEKGMSEQHIHSRFADGSEVDHSDITGILFISGQVPAGNRWYSKATEITFTVYYSDETIAFPKIPNNADNGSNSSAPLSGTSFPQRPVSSSSVSSSSTIVSAAISSSEQAEVPPITENRTVKDTSQLGGFIYETERASSIQIPIRFYTDGAVQENGNVYNEPMHSVSVIIDNLDVNGCYAAINLPGYNFGFNLDDSIVNNTLNFKVTSGEFMILISNGSQVYTGYVTINSSGNYTMSVN